LNPNSVTGLLPFVAGKSVKLEIRPSLLVPSSTEPVI